MAPERSARTVWIVVAIVVLVVAALVAAGFALGWFDGTAPLPSEPDPVAPSSETTAPSGEPTATEEPPPPASSENPQPPVVAGGSKVYTPRPGSEERSDIADAVRRELSTDADLVIAQLYSNGAFAVGQFTPQSETTSYFVAVRNLEDTGWSGYYTAAKGSASAAAVSATDDRTPDAVLAKVQWAGVAPSTAPSTAGRPAADEVVSAAKRLVEPNSAVKLEKGELLGLTQDAKKRWWGWVVLEAAGYDPLSVFVYQDAGSWKIYDFGTGIEPEDLPADVKFQDF